MNSLQNRKFTFYILSIQYVSNYKIAKLIVPYAVTKKNKLQEIIDHYDQNKGNKGKNTRKS